METAEPYLAWEGPLGEGGLGLSVVAGSNSLQLEVGYWNVNLYGRHSSLFPEQIFHLISKDGDGFAMRRKGQGDLALVLQGAGMGEKHVQQKEGPQVLYGFFLWVTSSQK